MSDHQILSDIQSGKQEALKTLIEKYRRYVATIIANILGSCDDPAIDELVNDVFYAIWTHADRIRPAFLKAYLDSTARNQTKSYLRKRRELPMDLDTIDLPDEASDPESRLVQQETAEIIRKALSKMSPKDRKIFLYHYYYLKSCEEIAGIMHMSAGTVRSRLSRGRKVLQQTFEKEVSL